jgi:NADH-quinone oxidoreductase subunit N
MGPLLAGAGGWNLTLITGFVMFVGGLGFKLSMVPFHMWAPDVYEGAPTPITALIATLSKAAAIALLLRFLAEAGSGSVNEWRMPLAVLAAATMIIGSLSALPQTNIKRLLAYSSIAQIGFILVGIVPNTVIGANAVLLHVIGYAFTTLAAFTVVVVIELKLGKESVADFAGLSKRAPVLAMIMTGALFSLAGLPIFAGFLTKFYLFTSAVDKSLEWLVVIAVGTSVISLYYYIRVIREMYITETEDGSKLPVPLLLAGLAWVMFAGTIAVGTYPQPFVDATNAAVTVLTPWIGL